MESIGVVRQLDPLGRVVLPVELRRRLNLDVKDLLEIAVDGDTIRLRRYEPSCLFCGGTEGITRFRDRPVCLNCLRALRAMPLPGDAPGV